MLQAFAVGPSDCVQLSGSQGRRGAARSLPSPSLTCLRVWELLWLEQPPPVPRPQFLSPLTSSACITGSNREPLLNQALVGWRDSSKYVFPRLWRKKASRFFPPFITCPADLGQFEASSEKPPVPLIFKLKWLGGHFRGRETQCSHERLTHHNDQHQMMEKGTN